MKVGDNILCHSKYTGRTQFRKIVKISPSGKKVTVERLDWKTGKAEFYFHPTMGHWSCEYASEIIYR